MATKNLAIVMPLLNSACKVVSSRYRRSNLVALNHIHTSSVSRKAQQSSSSSAVEKKMESVRPLIWCCSATVDRPVGSVRIDPIAGCDDIVSDSFPKLEDGGRSLDLANGPDWMEYIERTENRLDDAGGAGAYDSIRCDLLLRESVPASAYSKEGDVMNRWRVWGEDFHLKRIRKSYQNQYLADIGNLNRQQSNENLDRADEHTHLVMKTLLDKAASSTLLNRISDARFNNDCYLVQPVRLTLLWSPPKANINDNILVRGHVVSSGPPLNIYQSPAPIVVSVATVGESSLPTRFQAPQNKVASWCRLRRQLSDKPPGVAEVIMVKKDHNQLHILEGTSSNVFVIYKNGTIRTAQEGVLHGYVRQLVLDVAEDCGLKVDPTPITLQDASDALWEEAFITSSSRLIFPISRVLMPTDDASGHHFSVLWEDPFLQDNTRPEHDAKWKQLLDLILIRGGGYAH